LIISDSSSQALPTTSPDDHAPTATLPRKGKYSEWWLFPYFMSVCISLSPHRENLLSELFTFPSPAADHPKIYQLMRLKGKEGRTVKVIEGVAAEWEQLAYTLQFSPAVVRAVRRDTNQDCATACEEVLYRWVSGAEGTLQPVSWATLIECLRDCDFIGLAKDLENSL